MARVVPHAVGSGQPVSAQILGFSRQFAKQPCYGKVKLNARIGQDDAAHEAAKQWNTEMILERLDVPAHCAMRDVQLLGRQRHAQQSCCGFQGAQSLKRRKPVEHIVQRSRNV